MNSKILHAALFCVSPEGHWGLPVFLWSSPGVGKTHFVRDIAARSGLAYERLSPGERGEGQFGVVPVPGADDLLHYPAPDWSAKFTNGGILFIDELNTAPPALQAPLLGLVQLRTLGSHVFPKRTRVVAAANETMQAAGGWDLAPALANRFGHFDFDGLDNNSWGIALMGNFANMEGDAGPMVNAEAEEHRVAEAWPGAIATAASIVASFIRRKPGMLHMQPKTGDDKASKAWPSRRSWHYATTALASAKVHGLNEIDTDTFLAGFVGIGAVQELATHRTHLDLPEPADLLDGKVTWKHDSRRLDRTIAVLGACAGLVAPEKAEKRKDRGNRCWELIGSVLNGPDSTADCAIPAARVMLAAKMTTKDFEKTWIPLGDRLRPILVQAGIVGS
jgi:MoxR-like ATPase